MDISCPCGMLPVLPYKSNSLSDLVPDWQELQIPKMSGWDSDLTFFVRIDIGQLKGLLYTDFNIG